ncbi:MAG: hypothetical protein K9L83_10535 [Deltaproteobacteria bacterium]|nr:hypothetical protein [Deltaproteobacteria bacterium]
MKVDIVQEMLKSALNSTVQKKEQPGKERFGAILEETMKGSADPKAARETHLPSGLTGIGDIQGISAAVQDETPILEKTTGLVNVLDEYRELLGARHVSTEELRPIINEIGEQSEGLSVKLDTLAEGSPLKEIANQALMVSSLEVMKFNRGDYEPT